MGEGKKVKLAECARRGCASPHARASCAREHQAEASMTNVRSMGEGNEKEEGDERNKGQIEKKSPCFCPFVCKVEK